MAGGGLPFADWLQLTGNPADAGLHFVGTFERRITFYSQQVRALRLVHALKESGSLQAVEHIAVVGAGAAGVTAAMGFALLGNDVTLYDPAGSILQLQSASPRLLHPHIYEWPNLGSLDDRAGLPILDWVADTGGVVSKRLQTDFDAARARLPNLSFKPAHNLTSVERVGKHWRLGLTSPNGDTPRQFDRVVLAIGFGDEIPSGGAPTIHYWKQNSTGSAAAEPHSPTTYIVSGNGDGGLTDLLSLVIQDFEHVEFTRRFLNYFRDDALRLATDAAYNGAIAQADLAPHFDTHLLPLLTERGVIDRLAALLRTDRHVTINSSGPLLTPTRAAQLNQVMAFAVLKAATQAGLPIQRSSGLLAVKPSADRFTVSGVTVESTPLSDTFDHAVIRHGPDRPKRYAPAGQYFDIYGAHVKTFLEGRPELLTPPILDSETYDLFESLRIAKLEDQASQTASYASATQAKATIVLGLDPAAHVAVEQGSTRLRVAADQCEQLSGTVTLLFTAAPTQLPAAKDMLRLSRASGGRIQVAASPSAMAEWQKLIPTIGLAASATSRYAPIELGQINLAEAVDACLLRLLDQRIQGVLVTNHCDTIGPIHASITAAIRPVWIDWHSKLAADKALLKVFLRWLANVDEHEGSPWDGDHARLPRLATALIMMLAAYHGEPLEPAAAERGNMKFRDDAVALGSGCEQIGTQPISIWNQPDQWGVDALILSGSAEVEVADPPGRVMDGGKTAKGISSARRVRPVVIRNDKVWRARLTTDLAAWQAVVKDEFASLRQRQDKELEELAQ